LNLKTYTCIVTATLVATAAHAQADAISIIRAASKAGTEVKSAEYTVEGSFRTTKVKSSVWQVNAPVKDSGYAPGKYRVKGTVDDGNGEISYFEFAYDGTSLRIKADNDDVRVVEHPDAYAAGQQIPGAAEMTRLSVIGDFDWLLSKKPELRLLGEKKIGKWTCDVVEVKYTVSSPVVGDTVVDVRWAFDRGSHLPIQRTSEFGTTTILKLTLNPKIDDKVFRLEGNTVKANPLGPATDKLLAIGSLAPDFALKDAKGKVHSLKSYRGKVLVLDFWATWCLPCRQTMPILQKLHKEYGGSKVAVLGISVDQDYDPVAFMKRMGLSYPIALRGMAAAKAYRAVLLPTLYVIGPDGRIRYRQAGINRNDATNLPRVVSRLRSSP
jgi:peroxiredoxin